MISTWRNADSGSFWTNSDNISNFTNVTGAATNQESSAAPGEGWPPFYFGEPLVENTYVTIGGFDHSDIPDNAIITGVEIALESGTMDMIYQSPLDVPIHSFQHSTNCTENTTGSALFGPEREQQVSYDNLDGWTPGMNGMTWESNQYQSGDMNAAA